MVPDIVDIVPTFVQRIYSLVKDLYDKLDEKEAVVSKRNLIEQLTEYYKRKQKLLFYVDYMLSLLNDETQRLLSRRMTEWEELFTQ